MTDLSKNFSIKTWPEGERPREKLIRFGAESLTDAELLAILLRVGKAGYALKHHEQNPLIDLFEPQDTDDKVPFDLNTFKYVPISQAAEIPGKLKPEIIAILKDAGAIINGGDS